MPVCSFSQGVYPQTIVIKSDTVVAISLHQLDLVNTAYLQLDECLEVQDTLQSEITLLNKVIEAKDRVIDIASSDSLIQSEMNLTLKAQQEELEKELKREHRRNISGKILIGAVAALEGVAIILLLIK